MNMRIREKEYEIVFENNEFYGFAEDYCEAAYYYAKKDKHNVNQAWNIYRVLNGSRTDVGIGVIDDRGILHIYSYFKVILKSFDYAEVIGKIKRREDGIFEIKSVYGDKIAMIREVKGGE